MKRALIAAALAAFACTTADAAPQAKNGNGQAPRYVVDPFWPKTLPDNWMLGQVAPARQWRRHRLGDLCAENGGNIRETACAEWRSGSAD